MGICILQMLLSRSGEEICEPFLERDWDEVVIPVIMAFQNTDFATGSKVPLHLVLSYSM